MKATGISRYVGLLLLMLQALIGQAQVESKPNIVLIMVDDGRYDEYRPTGAPDWFVAPNIERIANEGVNFNRTYAPTPLCGPSRASVYTGLYSHQHGTVNNGDGLDSNLTMIQDILNNEGYYTGFIGKFGNGFYSPTDFDYWVDIGDSEAYKNTWIKVNGVNIWVPGHITNSFNDYINDFMDSAAVHHDQPFALFFFPLAPHTPNTPRAADAGLYIDEVMPFPHSFFEYDSLYPSYYKEGQTVWVKDSASTADFIMDRFACLIGVDDNVLQIFNHLDATGETDSTFMLYTSDNGYISGEHRMRAKALPIEESIRIPMFVRYPAWFPTPMQVNDDMVELVDIAKTVIDAINVPDTFGFMGHSMKTIAAPDTTRKYVFYQYEGAEPDAVNQVPDLRGIRSLEHLYVYSNCDCWSEEFYDFIADPDQDVNQILNPAYYAQVQQYRGILDSILVQYADTAAFITWPCELVGAYEVPDMIDNDCDALVDDSLDAFVRYIDLDGDGYGSTDSSLIVFGELPGFVSNGFDCVDTSSAIHPAAVEICDNIDNDCDGLVDDLDPDVVGMTIWYYDNDMDGFGDPATSIMACFNPLGYITEGSDCNDGSPMDTIAYPETCNTIDDDCDGLIDDADPDVLDQLLAYFDADGDGYGNDTLAIQSCFLPEGYVLIGSDCNDSDTTYTLSTPEICNAIDDDCDGLKDDDDPDVSGQTLWYADMDQDGVGDFAVTSLNCFVPDLFTDNFGDCNDADSSVTHGSPEICNAIDDDCDGLFDDADPDVSGQSFYFIDVDADGFGAQAGAQLFCFGSPGYVTDSTDCNDAHAAIFPLAVEICDGLDNNCNGLIDDADTLIIGQSTWYADTDGDAFGDAGAPLLSCNEPPGYVDNALDCNDADIAIHPDVMDICDAVNNDCDLLVDEDPILPVVTAGGPTTFCKGSNVTLTASPVISGFTYQWYKSASPIAGATGLSYVVTSTGSYKVRFTAPAGCVTESAFTSVTVNSNPKPTITNTTASNDLCINNPVKLSCKNKIGSTFQWYKGVMPLAGATTNKYNATTPGNYKVQQVDATGCFGTSSAYVVAQTCREVAPYTDVEATDFRIYPNPNDGRFELEIYFGVQHSAEATIRIFSMIGDLVYESYEWAENGTISTAIALEHVVPSGIYIVEATYQQQRMFREIVIE